MKTLIATSCLLIPLLGFTQGQFNYSNLAAPTRIGASDGPLAGAGIWGQLLAGTNTASLTPIGFSMEHVNGRINEGIVAVAGFPPGTQAYVQMVAWDGLSWGTDYFGVPQGQIGRSDAVLTPFTDFEVQPVFAPFFQQPAIVPIPEPSTWALTVPGAGALWFATRARRRKSFTRGETPKG